MSIFIKDKSVNIKNIYPELARVLFEIEEIYREGFNASLTITSGNDGKHGKNSLHYQDKAVDLRIKNVPRDKWQELFNRVKTTIPDYFDVVLETNSPGNAHIHLEFQPKSTDKDKLECKID